MTILLSSSLAWAVSAAYPLDDNSKPYRLSCREPLYRVLLACSFCPYHSDREWFRLKTEEPIEFEKAVDWELRCQDANRKDEVTVGIPYLHSSLKPLSEVPFEMWIHDERHAQTSLFTDEKAAMEAWNNRTNTGYESGKRAERLRIVKELRAIRDEARNDAQEYRVNLTELIDSLEKGEEK